MPRQTENAAPAGAGLPDMPTELLTDSSPGPIAAKAAEAFMRKLIELVNSEVSIAITFSRILLRRVTCLIVGGF